MYILIYPAELIEMYLKNKELLRLPGLSIVQSLIYEFILLTVFFCGFLFIENEFSKLVFFISVVLIIAVSIFFIFYAQRNRARVLDKSSKESDFSLSSNDLYFNEKYLKHNVKDRQNLNIDSTLSVNTAVNEFIIDTVQAGIILAEPVGNRIIKANTFALRFLGCTMEEIRGHSLHDFFTPCIDCNSELICENENHCNLCLRSKKDDSIYIFVTVAQIETSDKKPILLETFLDISELEHTRRELDLAKAEAEKSSNAKSLFLASMSHEIRTPINTILGMSELLQRTDINAEQRIYIEIAKSCGDNMLRLFSDILDYSKIESGKLDLKKDEFNINIVLKRTVESVALTAHNKGLEIILIVAPSVPGFLKGDSARLQQVLINLMVNSCKFTDSGEIVLKVDLLKKTSSRADLIFTVSDSGVGIADGDLDKIFDSFRQAHTDSGVYGGIGLGLSICRELVSVMGGKIKASNNPGGGAEFTFEIPFEAAEGSTKIMPDSIRHKKALIIEPHEGVSLSLTTILRKLMVASSEVRTRDQLDKLYSSLSEFDVIFIDAIFIKQNGDLLEELSIRASDAKLILMVRLNELGCKNLAVNDFIKHVLVKPVHELNVVDSLQSVFFTSADQIQVDEKSRKERLTKFKFGTRILFVEDNIYNRILVSGLLSGSGLEIVEASNGLEALDIFKRENFDLVLMDVKMPIMDGVEASVRICEYEVGGGKDHTPLIAYTANVFKSDIERYFTAGFDDFLSKYLDVDEVNVKSTGTVTNFVELREEYRNYVLHGAQKIITRLVPNENWKEIFSIAHDWKGTGHGYDYDIVADTGSQICKAIEEKSMEDISRLAKLVLKI